MITMRRFVSDFSIQTSNTSPLYTYMRIIIYDCLGDKSIHMCLVIKVNENKSIYSQYQLDKILSDLHFGIKMKSSHYCDYIKLA
jgi:hypothetical protein